jgi:hypothetical protein
VDRHEIVGLSLEGPDHCPCAARPGHRAPERRGYLIFGDGRQFPNLFFYNSAARSAGPFSATFETHKAAGAAGDDRGYVSYNGREPPRRTTRARSAARRSLLIQIYGAAVLEDPVIGAEEGNTKPCGSTACIVSTARRENEQSSVFMGPSKSTARVITTFHDFADPALDYVTNLHPGPPVVALQSGGTTLTGLKTAGAAASYLQHFCYVTEFSGKYRRCAQHHCGEQGPTPTV